MWHATCNGIEMASGLPWWWGVLAVVGLLAWLRRAPPPPRSAIVVGGGWGGVLAARALLDAGVPSVVVLEASERLGGLTDTWLDPGSGQWIDSTTCYTTMGDTRLHALLRRYAQPLHVSDQKAHVLPEWGRTTLALPLLRYVAIWARWRLFGLPLADEAKPWKAFLLAHGLQPIQDLLRAALEGQGCGTADSLPALYALRCVTPMALGYAPTSYQLRDGFGNALAAIAADMDVRLGEAAVSVSRGRGGARPSVATRGGRTLSADVVVVAVDPHAAGIRGLGCAYAPGDVAHYLISSIAVRTARGKHGVRGRPPGRMYYPSKGEKGGGVFQIRCHDWKGEGAPPPGGVAHLYARGASPQMLAEPLAVARGLGLRPRTVLRANGPLMYMRHFTFGAIGRGVHRAAERMQGDGGVWLAGGGPLAFESVGHISDATARMVADMLAAANPKSWSAWVYAAWMRRVDFPASW
jgi:hypothetical protein